MHVKAHTLFREFLNAHEARPVASLVQSLSRSPRLGEFLEDLDPDLSLDWSGQSFYGMPELRRHILQRTGTGGAAEIKDVLVTAGAAEANFLALSQLVQPGDEIVVDVPGWPQPLVLGEAIGAQVRRLQRREDRAWRFDLDELEHLVNKRTRLIFLCNPNNPTGQVLSEEELRAVVAIAERVGAYVLCDEVYAGLEWCGPAIPRVANYYERGISTGSVSKTLGLQGLRTGWLICRDPVLLFDALVLREDSSEIMNVMGEAIAEIALREARYAPALAVARAEGRCNLDLLDAWIDRRAELSWQRPAAGLIGFCRLHLSMTASELSRYLLDEPYRTFVMPGSAYDHPQHLRLGIGGGEPQRFTEALGRLGAALDKLQDSF